MTRTILVTGGAGFVGSHLCESLLEDGHEVVCLDDFSSGRAATVEPFRDDDRFTLVEGDVRDPFEETLDGHVDAGLVDRVYHLASRASPVDFEEYPVKIATTNAAGTKNALEFARRTDARVLFGSSSEVYGDPEVHPQEEEYNGNVNIRGPRACYNEGKRFGEALAVSYRTEYDLDVRTVRIFNTYGPRMRPDDGRVIPTFLAQALSGRDLTVYGDGTQTRSFTYVDDLIGGLRALMDEDGLAGEAVNVGNTDEVTINELAEAVLSITGADVDVTYEPLPEDDPKRRQPKVEKARTELGWTPDTDLEEGLRRTADWFGQVET